MDFPKCHHLLASYKRGGLQFKSMSNGLTNYSSFHIAYDMSIDLYKTFVPINMPPSRWSSPSWS